MTSLLTNSAAMTALTTLKSINSNLDATSNRVSTGQRVSNAADNAAYWSIATTVRTDNASLSAVKDSLGLGSSAVDTAYNGLNSILSDLQNMRAKLQTALQPGVDRSKVQTEIAALQSKMKATADSSNSSGQNWLSVNSSATNTAYKATQNVVAGFARSSTGAISFSQITIDVQSIRLYDTNSTSVTTAATNAQVVGATALTGTAAFRPNDAVIANRGTANFSGNNEVGFTLTTGGTSVTVRLNADTLKSAAKDLTKVTTDEFLSAFNNQIAASGLAGEVTASLDNSGRLTFSTSDTGAATGLNVSVAAASLTTGGTARTLIDAGFGTAPDVASVTGGAYSNLNLSSGSKVISINDGTTAKTITLNAASYTALGGAATSTGNTAVNGTDIAAMLNAELAKTAAPGASTVSATFAGGKITLTNGVTGKAITLGGADVADFGFTAGATAAPAGRNASGTDAGTTQAQGILDTNVGTYTTPAAGTDYSIATLDISKLVGTTGDTDLSAIITAVDKAIAKVTDAGTKLGAGKTQIDGQKSFVDTLMKANDRTIGILVDADVEEESTKLKALQTQQQLAVQTLSIANSSTQSILSLFR
ncbi:flagellin [Methylorubrum populi]|uniref:flagellin N-terminal helical domain-containing protein n=1 Tax=Methylorubrum populi TaxID=223967 RepID=UPI001152E39D|nr:flagellin [Methylorubrum populi]QDI79512.1 flagellin [Methylorubrum populi]